MPGVLFSKTFKIVVSINHRAGKSLQKEKILATKKTMPNIIHVFEEKKDMQFLLSNGELQLKIC